MTLEKNVNGKKVNLSSELKELVYVSELITESGERLELYSGPENYVIFNPGQGKIKKVEVGEGFEFERQGGGEGFHLVFRNRSHTRTYNPETGEKVLDYLSKSKSKRSEAFLRPLEFTRMRFSQSNGSSAQYGDDVYKRTSR